MQYWDLTEVNDGERTGPRVLFSTTEARGVVVELAPNEELGDHRVRERALVQVVSGKVRCSAGGDETTCGDGTLIVFDPGELHSLEAMEPTRLFLVLAPWPGQGHYDEVETEDPHELPANATQLPRRG